MADADILLKQGDLSGARAALVAKVKAAPTDAEARMFLFQLMCVQGDWDKASIHLRTLAELDPAAAILAGVYGKAIEGEKLRADVFAGKAAPVALVSGVAWMDTLIEAIAAFAQADRAKGEALRDAAFDAAGDTPGKINGEPIDWIADCDARFGPCFEAMIGGRWGLLPFEAVESITTEGPLDLRDLVWLQATITLTSGSVAAALLPVRYPGSERDQDPDVLLGRSTVWRETPIGEVGLGQKLWATSAGEDIGLLSLRDLRLS
jgi:type VI secretion system protein ImpE